MSMSIFQCLMLSFVWKLFGNPLYQLFLLNTHKSMHLLGHPAFMKMWIILLKMIYIFWN